MPDLRNMKLAYAYSNMSEREKHWWNEYKRVRSMWIHTKQVVAEMGPEKPRYFFDSEANRWRPSRTITRNMILRKEAAELYRRLHVLASYLYQSGYVAPDFKRSDLKKVSQPA